MRKYLAFFRLQFQFNLQYRTAAAAGIITQFAWGFLEVLVFQAFYRADAKAFPMELPAVTSYIWLQQAFLAFFMVWFMENEIFTAIEKGDIAYELCRPVDIYNLWFSRTAARRLSKAFLRATPMLIIVSILPKQYGLNAPADFKSFLLFLVTMILGLLVTTANCMIVYMLCFFTISSMGIRMVFLSITELFTGSIIPLPFFPDSVRKVIELLPFASMQNVPLRIYSGDLSGEHMKQAILLQIGWMILLCIIGHLLKMAAMKRITVQGG